MRMLTVPLGVLLLVLGFALLVFARKVLDFERRLTGVTDEDLQQALIFSASARLWVNRLAGVVLMVIGALFASVALFGGR